MKNIYVGNLTFDTTPDELRELFAQHGRVAKAQIASDRETGRSRGFGFVEMEEGGDEAIAALNGKEFKGRSLTVNEARPREARSGGGGGRGGYGGGRGGSGGRSRY
jgi:RNA recognition motif-containing protein